MNTDDHLATVIIVNWNGLEVLAACLDSLMGQTEQRFKIIFVDNGSTDNSIKVVAENYPNTEVVALEKNYGFAKANNIAFAKVRTKYTATLNNDIVARPEWLSSLINGLENNDEAGFAASKMLFHENPDVIDRVGDAYSIAGSGILRGRGQSADSFNKEGFVFGACAGAALYRTDMLKEIGFFDDDFFILYEDVDLSFRAQLGGYRCLYVPDAVVYHHCSRTIGNDSFLSVYYGHRNLEWVFAQNVPTSLLILMFPFHLIYNLLAFMYFATKGHHLNYIKAKFDAARKIQTVLAKRRVAQKTKKEKDFYIWSIIEKKYFLLSLYRRIRR